MTRKSADKASRTKHPLWLKRSERNARRSSNRRPLRFEFCEDRNMLSGVSIGGVKFEDLDADGKYDPCDLPLGGITIELYQDDGDGVFDDQVDQLIDTQVTADGTGEYTFDDLDEGLYFVREVVPTGATPTLGYPYYAVNVVGESVGSLVDDFDSPGTIEEWVIAALNSDPTTIGTAGSSILGSYRALTIDVLGTAAPNSASGGVGNGTLSFYTAGTTVGSKGVLTYDSNGAGFDSPIDLTNDGTNTGLQLNFNFLEIGALQTETDLEITITGPGGSATFSGTVEANPDAFTHLVSFSDFTVDAGFDFTETTSISITLNGSGVADVDFELDDILVVNPNARGYDFGNSTPGSLSGFVYADTNNNGVFDASESPIPNTTVTLVGVDVLGEDVFLQTTTDANGAYLFENLRTGNYTIRETQPDAWYDGLDTLGSLGGDDTVNDQFSNIDLGPGDNGVEYNFGEYSLRHPSKRYLVFPVSVRPDLPDGSGADQPTGVAELLGTECNDIFEFTPGDTPSQWIVTINGETQTIDTDTGLVYFNGLGGDDTAILHGSDGEDSLTMGDGFAIFVGSNFAVTMVNVEDVEADGVESEVTAATVVTTEEDTPETTEVSDDDLQAQPVSSTSETIELKGTAGDDTFEFVAGATPSQWVVKVNGVAQAVVDDISEVVFDGLGGNDIALLTGTDGSESLVMAVGTSTFTGDGFIVTLNNVEQVKADGLGGDDTASIYDTVGDDFVVTWSDGALLTADTVEFRADDFEQVYVHAQNGGYDAAKMYDSAGDDTLTATRETTTLTDGHFISQLEGVEAIDAYASSGGNDVATLYDSAGDDTFASGPIEGKLFNDSYYNRAKLFDEVVVIASTGNDVAKLYDSAGDDHFVSTPTEATLSGEGFSNTVQGFDAVHAYATQGGNDVATLYDSAGDDLLVAQHEQTALYNSNFYTRAKFFEEVAIHADNGGNDRASLYDSAGDDVVNATDDWAEILYGDSAWDATVWLSGIEQVYANSTNGGDDVREVGTTAFDLFFNGLWSDV